MKTRSFLIIFIFCAGLFLSFSVSAQPSSLTKDEMIQYTPLGAMVSCQFCASVPSIFCLEWHWISRWERWTELIYEEPLIEDGHITLSDKPGIGVIPNEEAIRKTALEGIPFFQ